MIMHDYNIIIVMWLLYIPADVREDDRQQPAEEEEQSIIKGLLPCIAGVGGVAIAIWLFVYLYVPPQST